MMLALEKALKEAAELFPSDPVDVSSGEIEVESELASLLHIDGWSADQLIFFHGWMKKMDVAKIQYLNYDANWKPGSKKNKITQNHTQLSILMALKYLQSEQSMKVQPGQVMKTINVLFKMLDQIESVFGLCQSKISAFLQQKLNDSAPIHCVPSEIVVDGFDGETLPITVLFSEGPIARAYLETLSAMGLKVNKIINLVSRFDLVSKKPVGGMLPQSMKIKYAANKQYKQMFYWSKLYQSKNADAVTMIQSQVKEKLSVDSSSLQHATNNRELTQYADCVESLFISGLKDPKLLTKLAAESDQLFLYTGGGIVPESLLTLTDKKLIHIHPGYLPEIRGADCVLWSQVLRQTTSASAFFMAPGIDVGDVLHACWLPPMRLNFPHSLDSQVKYRLIYSYLDPWVRSFVLQQLIHVTQGLTIMSTRSQDENEGMTYHFMHDKLKQLAYERFK